jgi:hypothetical protein
MENSDTRTHFIKIMNTTTKAVCFRRRLIVGSSRYTRRPTITVLGLIILCVLLLGCSSGSKPSQSPLDAEARQKGEEYWYSALTKCGDSYYGKDEPSNFTYQFNDVSIELSPTQLTEASRLNGVEWSGFATLRCKTSRLRVKTWEPWQNGSAYPLVNVEMKRVTGKWLFHGDENRKPLLKPIDCSEVK